MSVRSFLTLGKTHFMKRSITVSARQALEGVTAVSATGDVLTGAQSSLPKETLTGAKWDYSIVAPIRGDGSQQATVFRAEVIPRGDTEASVPKWAVIKYASRNFPVSVSCLEDEHKAYLYPSVESSASIRKMYDAHGFDDEAGADTTPYLALEWLQFTLAELQPRLDKLTYVTIAAIIEAVMSSCVGLAGAGLVNTDLKPANILITDNEDTGLPTVKVGDLGMVYPSGSKIMAQPHAMRAPEVHQGFSCVYESQVWACAAMILVWLKPWVLGVANMREIFMDDSWSIAKLMRLFPHWNGPPSDGEEIFGHSFELAAKHLRGRFVAIDCIAPLEVELAAMNLLPQLRELLVFMFVVDPAQRPDAAAVLASKQLSDLKSALGMI